MVFNQAVVVSVYRDIIPFLLVLYSMLLPLPFGLVCIGYTIRYKPQNTQGLWWTLSLILGAYLLMYAAGVISDNLVTAGDMFNWIINIMITLSYILGFRYLLQVVQNQEHASRIKTSNKLQVSIPWIILIVVGSAIWAYLSVFTILIVPILSMIFIKLYAVARNTYLWGICFFGILLLELLSLYLLIQLTYQSDGIWIFTYSIILHVLSYYLLVYAFIKSQI